MPEDRALSVTEAMTLARAALEGLLLLHVIGEVSEVTDKPGYKAVYFTLGDGSSVMSCLAWRDAYAASGVVLRPGMLARGDRLADGLPAQGSDAVPGALSRAGGRGRAAHAGRGAGPRARGRGADARRPQAATARVPGAYRARDLAPRQGGPRRHPHAAAAVPGGGAARSPASPSRARMRAHAIVDAAWNASPPLASTWSSWRAAAAATRT